MLSYIRWTSFGALLLDLEGSLSYVPRRSSEIDRFLTLAGKYGSAAGSTLAEVSLGSSVPKYPVMFVNGDLDWLWISSWYKRALGSNSSTLAPWVNYMSFPESGHGESSVSEQVPSLTAAFFSLIDQGGVTRPTQPTYGPNLDNEFNPVLYQDSPSPNINTSAFEITRIREFKTIGSNPAVARSVLSIRNPGETQDNVVYGTVEGDVVRLNQNLSESWRVRVSKRVNSLTVLNSPFEIVVAHLGGVTTINPQNGTVLNSFLAEDEVISAVAGDIVPSIAGDEICYVTLTGQLVVKTLATGAAISKSTVGAFSELKFTNNELLALSARGHVVKFTFVSESTGLFPVATTVSPYLYHSPFVLEPDSQSNGQYFVAGNDYAADYKLFKVNANLALQQSWQIPISKVYQIGVINSTNVILGNGSDIYSCPLGSIAVCSLFPAKGTFVLVDILPGSGPELVVFAEDGAIKIFNTAGQMLNAGQPSFYPFAAVWFYSEPNSRLELSLFGRDNQIRTFDPIGGDPLGSVYVSTIPRPTTHLRKLYRIGNSLNAQSFIPFDHSTAIVQDSTLPKVIDV